MQKYIWVYDSQSGVVTIHKKQFEEIKSRIIILMGKIAQNIVRDIKLKSQFCYLNIVEDCNIMSVCRMRYFDVDKLSFALYTYGNDTYQPCLSLSGKDNATIKEILDSGTMSF